MGFAFGLKDSIVMVVIVGILLIVIKDILGSVVNLIGDGTAQFFIYAIPIGIVIGLAFYVINRLTANEVYQ